MKTLLIKGKEENLTEEETVIRFKGLINKQIKNYCKTYEREDLVQIASIALIKAYRNYDISKGIQFITLASLFINRQLWKLLRDKKKYDKSIELSLNSINKSFGRKDESQAEYIDSIISDYNLEDDVIDKITVEGIKAAMNDMDPELKNIIYMRYWEGKIQKEIASELNIPLGSMSRKIKIANEYIRNIVVWERKLYVIKLKN